MILLNELTCSEKQMMKATNLSLMKERNKKFILKLIYQQKRSRASLAATSGLTKAAVSLIADELIEQGLVYEEESDYQGVGRKPINLAINGSYRYVLGINITREYFEAGIINMAGDIICEERLIIENMSPNIVLTQIPQIIIKQMATYGIDEKKILGAGVSVPETIDGKNENIFFPPNVGRGHDLGFAKRDFKIGTAVYQEKISRAAAVFERYFGSCKKENDYICVWIDDVIGAGVVSEGKLFKGASGFGGEIGHISIDKDGIPCYCGNVGCFERYASIPAILEGTPYRSWKEVVDSKDADLIEKQATYLTAALVTAVNLFGLCKIVVGGKLSYKGEIICEIIEKKLSKCTATQTEISVSPSVIESGVAAAGSIVIDRFLNE